MRRYDDGAARLAALGEPTRLRLAALLAVEGEACVCHLAAAIGAPDFKVSRHLGVLRAAGLVEARRRGTWMHYRLTPPRDALAQRLRAMLRDCVDVRRERVRLSKAAC